MTISINLAGIPSLLAFAFFAIESPRWQLHVGRVKEAKHNLKLMIHKWNRRFDVNIDEIFDKFLIETDTKSRKINKKYWYKHLFYTKELTKYTAVLMVAW